MVIGCALFSRPPPPYVLVARPNPRLASFSSGGCLAFSSVRSFACLAVALGRGMSGVSLGPRLTPLLELTAAV